MEGLSADLSRLTAAAAALAARDIDGLEAPAAQALHREVRAACDRLLAFAARLLAQVEDDGRWEASGARTFPEWVARQSRSSVGAVRREAVLGRALRADLPGTRRAVDSGEITLEHAQVLARLAPTSSARRTALASELPDRNEAHLVAKAKRMGVEEFGRLVKRWAAGVDVASHEAEHRAACARERFVMAPRDNGVALEGFLTVEHGDVVATALRAVIGVPSSDDKRSPDERRAQALVELGRLALDKGLAGGGVQVRPHISVHVPWESFCRLAREHGAIRDGSSFGTGVDDCGFDRSTGAPVGEGNGVAGLGELIEPAELDDGQPIPPSVLARIACDSEISRIVFGPQGQPLDVGRAQRTFTGAIRRAIVARDRRCCYPGCDAPPMLGEVHHVTWWARDGGPTSVSNGILLCWYHHDLVHRRNLTIVRADGWWQFKRPDGVTIGVSKEPGESLARGEGPARRQEQAVGEGSARRQEQLALAL